ncbi:MAG: S41 family peptidase [Bacteroidaceae bacterium]|nr:S41 family peptidase [Bacteroidaceae bacterium]
MNNKRRFTPLLMCLCVVGGIFIGTHYAYRFGDNTISIASNGSNKLNQLLQLIDQNYVDTVNLPELIEDAMPQILNELDPHSSYIKANDAEEASEELKGSFSGIGVSFTMQKDTVNVMSVIRGGPAEKVGILAGDRIVKADTTLLVGVKDTEVMKCLKGPKDSSVRLGIKRHGKDELTWFTVVRGDIPVQSVDASYMINEKTGYIQINKFGEQTYAEMLVALADLTMKGMKNVIIDLRGNTGGYMHIAIQMANEFLSRNSLITYVEGRNITREEYRSDGKGSFQKLPIIVLVDEGSASSSEIFAGAIQDNDRGTIIGRRTFGKGLVQQPMDFRDGSVVRLTIARYYTPSGRCIQKPYKKGHGEEYDMELLARYERGEFFSQDSIQHDGPEYKTKLGRTVYGGGGIMPDFFIPEDTVHLTSYYKEAIMTGLLRQFAFNFTDDHRKELNKCQNMEDVVKYLNKQNLLDKFARFGEKNKLRRRNLMLNRSRKLFERNLYANIIYNAKGTLEYVQYLNQDDPVVLKALDIIGKSEAFPKAPVEEKSKRHEK